MRWELWLAIAAVAIAAVSLAVALTIYGQQARMRRLEHAQEPGAAPEPEAAPAPPRLAFVANPSKEGVADLEEEVRRVVHDAGLPDPLWYETTVEDPGTGQTRRALQDGADVVVAVGGDGTVRAVAAEMVGTGRPMGLLPVGTGNLLARNLDLPVTEPAQALAVVLSGVDRPIDVGWARVAEFAPEPDADDASGDPSGDPDDGSEDGTAAADESGGDAPADDAPAPAPGASRDTSQKHIFLVIAGLGFDAAMVADADDALKAKVGWVAYFVAGMRHLHGRRMRARIQLDDGAVQQARLRSLMIGNCGKLPGGLTLLPDAVLDDGILDVAAIDTRGGIVGWAQLFGEVVMQGIGLRNDLPAKVGRIDHARARRVRVRVEGGEQAQVDGDPLGRAVELETWVQPGALVVRTA